jgi:Transmembrane secretion effector
MDAAWFAVFVLYVIQILHQKPGMYGLLLAIGAVGGIAVGGIGPHITRRLGPWRSLLIAGLVMAASQTVLGLSANVIIAAAMLAAGSAAFALFNMTAVTMRQRQVPDGLLGRITSLYRTVADGSEAAGVLAGGVRRHSGNPGHDADRRCPDRRHHDRARLAPPRRLRTLVNARPRAPAVGPMRRRTAANSGHWRQSARGALAARACPREPATASAARHARSRARSL